jgi:hypothetical protein
MHHLLALGCFTGFSTQKFAMIFNLGRQKISLFVFLYFWDTLTPNNLIKYITPIVFKDKDNQHLEPVGGPIGELDKPWCIYPNRLDEPFGGKGRHWAIRNRWDHYFLPHIFLCTIFSTNIEREIAGVSRIYLIGPPLLVAHFVTPFLPRSSSHTKT